MARSSGFNKVEEVFDALYARYAKGLLVYAREFSLSQEEAEDIIHDVFVSVWEKLHRSPGLIERSYLFKAARNGCLNYIEHLKVRSRFQEETLRSGSPQGALAPEMYVADELKSVIQNAVDKLPPRQKEAFLLNKFQNMSYAEIVAKLEISPRTVEKHVEVASKALREELFRYLHVVFTAYILLNR